MCGLVADGEKVLVVTLITVLPRSFSLAQVGGRYSRDDGLFTRDHPELDAQISRGRAGAHL